jgi:pimeloyl-ACP methyl ester carboxylesterase
MNPRHGTRRTLSGVQPLFEHRLTLAGYETRALELEGDGPPLLLLHGWADSADTWRLVLDRLARLDRRALALDMPGFGSADRLERDEAILPQLDRFVDAALAEIAPGGAALVAGNSLGGAAALRAAERADLAGIVPIAPAGLEMARWFALVERDPLIRNLLASPLPLPSAVVRRTVAEAYRRLAFRHPRAIDPLVIDAFTSHLATKSAAARILRTGSRLLPELRDPFELERIECPVLLVWGANDVMVFRTGAERVLAAAPAARLVVVEDCGHCPQIECPELLTDLVVGFPDTVAKAA